MILNILKWHFSFSLFFIPKTRKNGAIPGSRGSRQNGPWAGALTLLPHAPGARMTWVLTNSLKLLDITRYC
jgi:hypothetical protein